MGWRGGGVESGLRAMLAGVSIAIQLCLPVMAALVTHWEGPCALSPCIQSSSAPPPLHRGVSVCLPSQQTAQLHRFHPEAPVEPG